MGRHTTPAADLRAARLSRLLALAVLWLGGLAVGFFALLSVAATFSCSTGDHGLACRPAGTTLGAVLVLAVVAVVTATTLAADARRPGRFAAVVLLGFAALGGCYLAARALLGTA